MRISGSQSDRVQAVVDFMVIFYYSEELTNKKKAEPVFYQLIGGTRENWKEALSVAADFLKDPSLAKELPNDIISFFTDAANAGYSKEGLKILKNSACAPYMEPLIVALQMLTGEDYNAPLEVVEVAKDVLKKIEEKKKDRK
jgi:hypothetical protein